ncbi:hypothetical protein BU204_13830 [Actinophytocola xanthii]|uniref:RCC1-like domain-containing protein n=1 Tax=Actinophytocola xanthii TaxID=1912961 RepID=A0A1Q8CRM7_9PSEU|nr:hypothetical protein BU204_13830 [Actinophytocola xanthii]
MVALVAGLAVAGNQPEVPTPVPVAADVGSSFTAVTPARVLDTRNAIGIGTRTPVGPGKTITLNVSSRVPAGATAVVLNVAGISPTSATYVSVFPAGAARPATSNLNLVAGDIRPILTTVALGTNRGVTFYNNTGNVHLLADLAGYYAPGTGAKFTSLSPTRVLDTRVAPASPLGAGATREIDLSTRVPVAATAVTLNVTAVGATKGTYLTAWPTGQTRPGVSNLNLNAGNTRANMVTVPLGANRRVSLYNLTGSVNAVADVTGFYTPGAGATFVPRTPVRVFDTRTGAGTTGVGPIGQDSRVPVNPGTHVPANATAALLNVIGVNPTASTSLTVWARDGRPDGSVSTLTLAPGEIAATPTIAALSTMEQLTAYNSRGSVHAVADLAGVFVTPNPACTLDCAYTWGGNESWALGTGQRVPKSATPAQVVGISGVRSLTGGRGATRLALRTDGTVLAWGQAPFGQLGAGWSAVGWSAVPTPVPGLDDATAIAVGRYHALALREDGTVWSWGANFEGGLGDGQLTDSAVPVQVSNLTGVTAIAAADATSYALREDGTVWAWGGNTNGALGDASLAEYAVTPVQVSGLTGVTAIAGAGSGGYALRGDGGTVWSWGANWDGELGSGTSCDPGTANGCFSRVPVQVSGLTGVTAIGATPAGSHGATGFAVTNDGAAWAWGTNDRGTLGNGGACQANTRAGCHSPVPVRVSGLEGVTGIAGGPGVGYALRSDGSVWAWGENALGELGNGAGCGAPATCLSTVPVRVTGLSRASVVTPGGAIVPNP